MRIKPDLNLNSIYDIDEQILLERGIKALFFDLDSTVMKSKSGVYDKKTLEFFEKMGKNFKLAIISNNKNPDYIEKAKCGVNFTVVGCAKKPDTKVTLQVCSDLGLKPCECAFVGDRPLTDILCAKRAKMFSILVDSISKDEEKSIVRFARALERLSIKK